MIARNPWRFLFGCLIFAAISSLGLLVFKQEKNPMKLWIPHNSDFGRDTNWIIENFKEGYRMQYLMVKAPNVLEPYVLQEVCLIDNVLTLMKVNVNRKAAVCLFFKNHLIMTFFSFRKRF